MVFDGGIDVSKHAPVRGGKKGRVGRRLFVALDLVLAVHFYGGAPFLIVTRTSTSTRYHPVIDVGASILSTS